MSAVDVMVGAVVVAAVVWILLFVGCRAPMPMEPGYTVTHARDAGR